MSPIVTRALVGGAAESDVWEAGDDRGGRDCLTYGARAVGGFASTAVAHTSGVANGPHSDTFGVSTIVAVTVGGCPASAA